MASGNAKTRYTFMSNYNSGSKILTPIHAHLLEKNH